MPVENEIKIVLKGDHKEIVQCMGMLGAMRQEINQIYTTPNNRFREIVATIDSQQNDPIYTHTYKHMIEGQLLEIESTVSARDWQLAQPAAVSGLYKTRYSWASLEQHWDVDFLRTAPKGPRSSIYFMMAECELPEGSTMRLPSILELHVDLVVPQQYNELFTNARLTDQQYARAVVEDFRASL